MFKMKSIVFVLALTVAAGCGSNKPAAKKETHGEEFYSEYAVRSTHRFAEAQAASGARADGMLFASHFDSEELNSLGMQKLDLMLMDDDSTDTLMVYLAMPDDQANDRRDSVVAYLAEHGVRDAELAVRNGHNPGASHPAAANLARLPKVESTPEDYSSAMGEVTK